MTDDELEAIARWQSSHEGELAEAIRDMTRSIVLMENFMRYRSGLHELRRSGPELVGLMDRIQTIVYAATPRVQAAE